MINGIDEHGHTKDVRDALPRVVRKARRSDPLIGAVSLSIFLLLGNGCECYLAQSNCDLSGSPTSSRHSFQSDSRAQLVLGAGLIAVFAWIRFALPR